MKRKIRLDASVRRVEEKMEKEGGRKGKEGKAEGRRAMIRNNKGKKQRRKSLLHPWENS